MKIDFHIHTYYSRDSITSLKILNKICKKKEIIPCITDHNTIEGGLKYKKRYGNCIVGEEIRTKQGEVIGLYLNEEIKKGLSIEETYEKIKEQAGLIMLPHPFDRLRKSIAKEKIAKKLIRKTDIVEVFNGRTIFNEDNKKAENFAEENKLLKVVGSDAHLPFFIGKAYVLTKEFNLEYPKELIKALKKAVVVKRKIPPYVHTISYGIKTIRNLLKF